MTLSVLTERKFAKAATVALRVLSGLKAKGVLTELPENFAASAKPSIALASYSITYRLSGIYQPKSRSLLTSCGSWMERRRVEDVATSDEADQASVVQDSHSMFL